MTLQSLRTDSRGVSEVIGSILVFGLVVALISLLQVQAIPNANEEVEFEHSNQLSNDMADLRVAISETVDSGRAKEANVKLGADYPPRLLFFNPPPATGRLRTTDEAAITLRRVESSGSAEEFFDSSSKFNYSTRALEHTVDYRELRSAPDRVREPTVYYERHDNETLVKQSEFVDGREISLVAIGGNLTAGGVEAETIQTRPLSAPAKEYTVRDDGSGPINITVPTKLSAEKWNETLTGEYASGANAFGTTVTGGNGYVQKATYVETAGEFNELHVELKPNQEYTLRMAKVGFGTGGDPKPAYLVSVPNERSNTATIEVRDRFNNPVSGVTVWANASSGTLSNGTMTRQDVRVTTGPDGIASVERTGAGTTTVEFSEDLDENGTTTSTLETEVATFGGVDAPIYLTDATVNSGDVVVTVENMGPERNVEMVHLHKVAQHDGKLVTAEDNIVVSVLGTVIPLDQANTTYVADGPDKMTGFEVDGTSASLSGQAEENGAPVVASGVSVNSGSHDLTLSFDESVTVSNRDSVAVRFEVYYENGHREVYDVLIQSDD